MSPNDKWLASGHGGKAAECKIWDISGHEKLTISSLSKDNSGGQAIYSLSFTPDGQRIIMGGEGGIVQVLDLKGQPIQTLNDFQGASIYGISYFPKQELILCGSGDGKIRTFRMLP